MDLSTLTTTDHQIFDGVQTITLKNQAGTSSDTVAYVTSGPVSFKAMQLIGGGLVDNSQTRAFSLPVAECSFAPVDSSTITDAAGVVWRVLSIDDKTFRNRYVCNCVRDKLELSAPLPIPSYTATAGVDSITLSWSETSGATGYRVEVSLSSEFTAATVASGTMSSIVTGTTASVEVTGLTTGTWYVRVRRSNALGNSPWSDVDTAAVSGA